MLSRETDSEYLVRRINPSETIDKLLLFPRYFEIETVNACNAKCPMCTIADWNRKDGVMDDDLFELIASEIGQHAPEIVRVRLYRDGEPLLDKRLQQRIKRMKDAGVKEVGISTNAALLDEKRGLAILQAGLDEIIISVDSVYKDVYEKIRVGLDFETVVENTKRFFALRDGLRSPCRIRVRMIRQELNETEWERGLFQKQWMDYLKPGDTAEHRDIHNWGGQLSGFKLREFDTDRPCIALYSLMTIFADGSVPLCNIDFNKKHQLGNVATNSISALWQSHEQNRRRQAHRKEIDMCRGCAVWSEAS